MLAQRGLRKDIDLLAINPILARCLGGRPRPGTAAANFAPFHGEHDLIAAGIAIDNLWKHGQVGARPDPAYNQLLAEKIVELRNPTRVPGNTDRDFVAGAAAP